MVSTVLPFDVFLARSKNWVRKKFYFFSDTVTLIVSPYNLIDEINNQDLFLYGHRNISSEDNMKIILSTIKYIMETGKFA